MRCAVAAGQQPATGPQLPAAQSGTRLPPPHLDGAEGGGCGSVAGNHGQRQPGGVARAAQVGVASGQVQQRWRGQHLGHAPRQRMHQQLSHHCVAVVGWVCAAQGGRRERQAGVRVSSGGGVSGQRVPPRLPHRRRLVQTPACLQTMPGLMPLCTLCPHRSLYQ